MSNFTKVSAYKQLQKHKFFLEDCYIKDFFKSDEKRFEKFSVEVFKDKFSKVAHFDFSKNIVDEKLIDYFEKLAEQLGLSEKIEELFTGKKINKTENKSVGHIFCRNLKDINSVEDEVVKKYVQKARVELKKIKEFVHNVETGMVKGLTGKKFFDMVVIGIGGSVLGTKTIYEALGNFQSPVRKLHFISSLDVDYNLKLLSKLSPENTIVIVVSKSMKTQEVLLNFELCQNWLKKGLNSDDVKSHCVSISANFNEAEKLGCMNRFYFDENVGGRFSVWSAVGALPLSFSLGFENFLNLLYGAQKADEDFKQKDFKKNIPCLMAMLSVWYRNFLDYNGNAILPYFQSLKNLPLYLQQVCLESNGKSVDLDGKMLVEYKTAGIVFGDAGTDFQHSFGQLLHQGNEKIWCDFLVVANNNKIDVLNQKYYDVYLSNAFAQAEALMVGQENKSVLEQNFDGNRPSTMIVLNDLNPYNLGFLMAIYEHRVFVEGVFWGINSFDQFGVELGKSLAEKLMLSRDNKKIKFSSSTEKLLKVVDGFKR